MSELEELEQELKIAIKHNFDKREIENLKRLIENKKAVRVTSPTGFFRRNKNENNT